MPTRVSQPLHNKQPSQPQELRHHRPAAVNLLVVHNRCPFEIFSVTTRTMMRTKRRDRTCSRAVRRVGSLYKTQIDQPTIFAILCNRHARTANGHLLLDTNTERRKALPDRAISRVVLKL
jgi:hypothetical protein